MTSLDLKLRKLIDARRSAAGRVLGAACDEIATAIDRAHG
jgi:hypothetical protein